MNPMSEARARLSHRMAMHFGVEPFRLRNATPMVSFTFDDVPKSAATVGAAILEAHDAHGTFYVIGSQVGTSSPLWDMVDKDDVVTLHRGGHDPLKVYTGRAPLENRRFGRGRPPAQPGR